MPAHLGVATTFGLAAPAGGYVQESSKEDSVEVATIRDETGSTVKAVPKPLLDTIGEVDGRAKRSATWSVDGGGEIAFRPNFVAESIDFAEFRKRFEDETWCRANPDHPIAYLRAFSDTFTDIPEKLRGRKPTFLIRRGRRFTVIPQDAEPERKQEILALLG